MRIEWMALKNLAIYLPLSKKLLEIIIFFLKFKYYKKINLFLKNIGF
jgi:hypothetical protein